MQSSDVIVIGGGIAGVSIGYEIAAHASVCLLEAESGLAQHTTGRSAATYVPSYGPAPVRRLTIASRAFFESPPDCFEGPLLSPLPTLTIGPAGSAERVRGLYEEMSALDDAVRLLDGAEAEELNPVLRPGFTESAVLDPSATELDVHALHQGYLRGLRARGGEVVPSARVVAGRREAFGWVLTDATGREFHAGTVVSAAGAWVDELAGLLGAGPIGIRPLRRTLFTVPAPDGVDLSRVPFTGDVDATFYFRPEGDGVLCSPEDEELEEPRDTKPEMLEIARAIEAINEATTLGIRSVRSSWAGQRSFVPDECPVVGPDPLVDGLFWFAGQGGYGIQMAPALARLGAALLAGGSYGEAGVAPEELAPGR